ncbi:hypothetical protein EH223_06870 [candidate division KSB1 bacterium]|nr:hypothetical protein [candidate division KSB1 bacterium]RQW04711.1 MAG: hypothetical protein EH223_06870 [candidate division KSB1 bacterium]
MSESKKIQVGDEIEAMCGACKDATVHVVEVIKDGKITKVMCKSCLNSHRYRKPVSAGEKKVVKKAGKKSTKKAPAKTKEQRKWSRVMAKVEGEEPQNYDMSGEYKENDVIDHSKFGVGVVSEVIDPTKMSVVFEEGQKTLVHNRDDA